MASAKLHEVQTATKSWRGQQRACETCKRTIMPGQKYHWVQEWFMGPKLCYCEKHRPPDPEPEPDKGPRVDPYAICTLTTPEPPFIGDADYMECPSSAAPYQCVRGVKWRTPQAWGEQLEGWCIPTCKEGAQMFWDKVHEIAEDPDVHSLADAGRPYRCRLPDDA